MRIEPADLDAAEVAALLAEHLDEMHANSPACSVHALPIDGLRAGHVSAWTARDRDGRLLGIGALAELDPSHGEIKSMRTARASRGRGVGGGLLAHLLEEARRRGYARVSLETGTQEFFAPARRLYERYGFEPCPPFASYTPDPNSAFYSLAAVAPRPHNPARMGWQQVPAPVVAAIEDEAGARVVQVATAPVGFSPGFAGRVELSTGDSVFLKVISASRDPWSVDIVRAEATVVPSLPEAAPSPGFRWSLDDGEWVVIAFDAVGGRQPDVARTPADRAAVFDALGALAEVRVPDDSVLPRFEDAFGAELVAWRRLANAEDQEARLARLGSLRPWVERNLDALVQWEDGAMEATRGDRLVHGDMRADNLLVEGDHVWIVDWPYASAGAPWLDLLGLVPSMSMEGAGPAHRLFHDHPLAASVAGDAERTVVTAWAGYYAVSATEPELPALPGLRAFQRAQALPAIDWLRWLLPELS